MLIKTLPVGQLETNCYVVTDEESLRCAVIDPGDESNTILDYLEENHLRCEAILLTHGHFDHVGAVEAVAEETGAKVYLNRRDDTGGSDPHRPFTLPEGGSYYDEGDVITVGALRFTVIATPGHTPGGACFLFAAQKLLLTGDTLFAGSCGRTDFPGGDVRQLNASLRRLAALDPELTVVPGHGMPTTIAREVATNPFLQ